MPGGADCRGRRAELGWGAALFAAALAAFLLTPTRGLSDAKHALLVSRSVIDRGTVRLDRWFAPGARPAPAGGLPYQIEARRGHSLYAFPIGGPLLSIPFVAAAGLFGASPVDGAGAYDPEAERRLQHVLGGLLGAALVLLVFLAARTALPRPAAVLTALAAGFATPVWPESSRALWSHGWLLVLYAAALLLLLRHELAGRPLRPVLLATLLAWAFLARPTAAAGAIAIAGYVAWRRPRDLAPLVLTGLAWLALFVAFCRHETQFWLLPAYRPGRLGSAGFPEAAVGTLLSPGRGLLVYCPFVAGLAALLVRRRRALPGRPLAVALVAAVALHWLTVAAFPHWWGGHSYGPRLLVDTVPFLAALAALGLAGARPSRVGIAVAAALLAASVAIQAAGALSPAVRLWNLAPTDVDRDPARLWDLGDFPPLRALGERQERQVRGRLGGRAVGGLSASRGRYSVAGPVASKRDSWMSPTLKKTRNITPPSGRT